MSLFDLFRTNMPSYQQELNVEQNDVAFKWRKTNLYKDFLQKIEFQIEIHVDNIKGKNKYFDDTGSTEDMYCVDITPRYYRLRTVKDKSHCFDCSWEVQETYYNEIVLIGVSFFEKEYEQIDYLKIRGFLDALCDDLKRFQSNDIVISNYYDGGEDGDSSAHIWIDFKNCYRELKSVF